MKTKKIKTKNRKQNSTTPIEAEASPSGKLGCMVIEKKIDTKKNGEVESDLRKRLKP